MKVKLLVYDDEENIAWTDFYIDETYISGFYIPIFDDDNEPSVNVYFEGGTFTLKQEKHLTDYLEKRFVNVR